MRRARRSQDELSFIAEAQWHVSRTAFIRFNNGVGLTSKATDWAPEIGVVVTRRSDGGRSVTTAPWR